MEDDFHVLTSATAPSVEIQIVDLDAQERLRQPGIDTRMVHGDLDVVDPGLIEAAAVRPAELIGGRFDAVPVDSGRLDAHHSALRPDGCHQVEGTSPTPEALDEYEHRRRGRYGNRARNPDVPRSLRVDIDLRKLLDGKFPTDRGDASGEPDDLLGHIGPSELVHRSRHGLAGLDRLVVAHSGRLGPIGRLGIDRGDGEGGENDGEGGGQNTGLHGTSPPLTNCVD